VAPVALRQSLSVLVWVGGIMSAGCVASWVAEALWRHASFVNVVVAFVVLYASQIVFFKMFHPDSRTSWHPSHLMIEVCVSGALILILGSSR